MPDEWCLYQVKHLRRATNPSETQYWHWIDRLSSTKEAEGLNRRIPAYAWGSRHAVYRGGSVAGLYMFRD